MYLVFTRTPGESYRRQVRSLLLCSFPALFPCVLILCSRVTAAMHCQSQCSISITGVTGVLGQMADCDVSANR